MTNTFPAITVKQINGVWWLISSEGEPFVSIGLNHVDPYFLLGPYNKEYTFREYGSDIVDAEGIFNWNGNAARKWWNKVKKDLKSWHVNSLGYHTFLPYSWLTDDKNIFYVCPLVSHKINDYDEFPDVFTDQYAAEVDYRVSEVCSIHRINPNLIGYAFLDLPGLGYEKAKLRDMNKPSEFPRRSTKLFLNLMNKRILSENKIWEIIHPLVFRYMTLKQTEGKYRWIEILRKHYTDVKQASEAYNVEAASWQMMQEITNWPYPRCVDSVQRDCQAMLAAITEQYYKIQYTSIKKYDPNHLILGDKLNSSWKNIPHYLLSIVKKYVDVVFIEWFSSFPEQELELKSIYNHTKKPILLGDSSFACIKQNQVFTRGTLVKSDIEVGLEYENYMNSVMSLPFIIGWHHCGYMEGWEGLQNPHDSYASMQSGIIDPFEQTNQSIDAIVRSNKKAWLWHKNSGAN